MLIDDQVVLSGIGITDAAAVALLHGLVAQPSLSGNEQAAVAYLVAEMRRMGMRAWIDSTGNAVGSVGEGGPEIVLLGHIDTVAGEIPVRLVDGKMYGRGAVDAKGPLAAFVVAAARLGVAGFGGRITVVGCVEEESPSSRGAHGILGDFRPDFCVVGEPSGVDTITLGYKGSLRARLRIAQPCGHSAHNRPTVAEIGSNVWQRIRAWSDDLNDGRERAWDQLLPALVGIKSGSDGIQEWCELDLSIRLPKDCPPDAVAIHLQELVPAGSVTILGSVPAFRATRTSPLCRSLIVAMRDQQLHPRFVVKTGTADMNVVGPVWNCPIVTYGPGDSALDHTPDEHILVDEYLQSIRILEHALQLLIPGAVTEPKIVLTTKASKRNDL